MSVRNDIPYVIAAARAHVLPGPTATHENRAAFRPNAPVPGHTHARALDSDGNPSDHHNGPDQGLPLARP